MQKNENETRRGGLRRRLAVLIGLPAVLLFVVGGSAFATPPPDNTGTLFSGAQDSITNTLIPAVVALVLAGTLVWMGIAWFKRSKNKASS